MNGALFRKSEGKTIIQSFQAYLSLFLTLLDEVIFFGVVQEGQNENWNVKFSEYKFRFLNFWCRFLFIRFDVQFIDIFVILPKKFHHFWWIFQSEYCIPYSYEILLFWGEFTSCPSFGIPSSFVVFIMWFRLRKFIGLCLIFFENFRFSLAQN